MNQNGKLQEVLFQTIRSQIPAHLSLVDEISDLLGVSKDSAYRRIRGEKELSIRELHALTTRFNISVDTLFNLRSGHMIFTNLSIGREGLSFDSWINNVLEEVKSVSPCREKKLVYVAKDIPLFHFFDIPEIFAFKIFFWHKMLFSSRGFEKTLFSFRMADEYLPIGKEIMRCYLKIPSAELWNEETITSILRQVEFCHDSGFFATREHAQRLCDVIDSWLNHVRHQAELGYRFRYGSKPEGTPGTFRLYYNGILISENTILVEADERRTAHFTYNLMNLLMTGNPEFTGHIRNTVDQLMQKGTLLSGPSSTERDRFFTSMHGKVMGVKERIGM